MSSQATDTVIGMMDGAYFVGRREILEYFNNLLQLDLVKIEETASGAIACQVMDYLFPGSIPMHRVDWSARASHEYIKNYKLLQAAFTRNNIQKHIDVDKLIRAKYQDNLEFCQWLKAFCEHTAIDRDDYDPAAARVSRKGVTRKNSSVIGSKSETSAKTGNAKSSTRTGAKPVRSNTAPMKENLSKQKPAVVHGKSPKRVARSPAIVADAKLIKQNSDLSSKVNVLENNVIELEKERDFYFGKLRDIEVMLQAHDEKTDKKSNDPKLFKNIFKVLYATAEDELIVDNDGKLTGAFIDDLGDYEEDITPFDERQASPGKEPALTMLSPDESVDNLLLDGIEGDDAFLPNP